MDTDNFCNVKSNVIKNFDWAAYLMIMGILFPMAMIVFNFMLFARVIPEQFIRDYVVLTFQSPNFPAMYLSNFAHLNIAHLLDNMAMFMITIVFIAAVANVAIPYVNQRVPGMNCIFGTRTLVWSTITFLVIVPFLISIESIVAGNYTGVKGGLGFSGVALAFEGYLVYLVEKLVIRKIQVIMTGKNQLLVYAGITLVAMFPLIIIVEQIVTMYTSSVHANYPAHLLGFGLGIIVPFILDKIGEIETYIRTNQRVVVTGRGHD